MLPSTIGVLSPPPCTRRRTAETSSRRPRAAPSVSSGRRWRRGRGTRASRSSASRSRSFFGRAASPEGSTSFIARSVGELRVTTEVGELYLYLLSNLSSEKLRLVEDERADEANYEA